MNCELSIHYHSYVINVANQGYWACCRKLIILQTVFYRFGYIYEQNIKHYKG